MRTALQRTIPPRCAPGRTPGSRSGAVVPGGEPQKQPPAWVGLSGKFGGAVHVPVAHAWVASHSGVQPLVPQVESAPHGANVVGRFVHSSPSPAAPVCRQ